MRCARASAAEVRPIGPPTRRLRLEHLKPSTAKAEIYSLANLHEKTRALAASSRASQRRVRDQSQADPGALYPRNSISLTGFDPAAVVRFSPWQVGSCPHSGHWPMPAGLSQESGIRPCSTARRGLGPSSPGRALHANLRRGQAFAGRPFDTSGRLGCVGQAAVGAPSAAAPLVERPVILRQAATLV
jgi:hypothetical protein